VDAAMYRRFTSPASLLAKATFEKGDARR